MTDTTNTELRQRTNQSTYMDSDEVEEDQDLVMGDKEHLLRGDNLREMKGEDHQRERISNMNVTVFGWTFNKVIAVIHLNIFLYATCFWIQTGTMPYLSKKLGVDPAMFGYLQTVFALVQLAGGPLFGRFGDLFGGRAAMTLAFMSASATYLLLSLSTSVPLLFLSRLMSVFLHAMQGGQMIVTDLGDSNNRADALGKLGLSYGVGMVVGPVLGGQFTKHLGEEKSAFIAFLGSVLSVILVLMFVPKYTKRTKAEDPAAESIFSMKKWISLVAAPGALFLLIIRVVSGIPIGVFQSMFQVVALETFKLPADQNGLLMSYIGILTMIVQGIGVGIILKKTNENTVLKWASFILVWSYLLLAYVTNITQLCFVIAPLVLGLSSQNIVISSALTRTVADADTGAMLGLNMATNSFIRTISPTIGGIMLENFGFSSFGWFGFLASTVVTSVLFYKLKDK